jgi:hypothetical protein
VKELDLLDERKEGLQLKGNSRDIEDRGQTKKITCELI